MGPFCYSGVRIESFQGGEDGIGQWHPESPFYGLARFIKEFSGTLLPGDYLEGLLDDF